MEEPEKQWESPEERIARLEDQNGRLAYAILLMNQRVEYLLTNGETVDNHIGGILEELQTWEKRVSFLERAHPQLRKLGQAFEKGEKRRKTKVEERIGDAARAAVAIGLDPAVVDLAEQYWSKNGNGKGEHKQIKHYHSWRADWESAPPVRICTGNISACGQREVLREVEGEKRWVVEKAEKV